MKVGSMDNDEDNSEESEIPRIYVDIRIRRTIGIMPPMALAAWQKLKGVFFLGSIVATFFLILRPQFPVQGSFRIVVCLFLAWLLWDQVFARRHYGVSHVLITTKGVLFSDENLYVRWEEIQDWKHAGSLLRLRPKPGFGAKGLFAPRELDIPLTEANGEFLLDMFREKVERWRPDKS